MGIFPGQNTGVGCHALLQRIFPTQGSNPGLPHCRQVLYHLSFSAAAAKSVQSCPTLCDPIGSSPPGSPCPWDSPGKNTGVGCHFLLQCMKVKSEREVAQSCLTLSNPMDCSLPGSSVCWIFQARVLEWGAIAFSEIVQQTNFISLVASLSATSPFSETFQSQNIEVSLTVSTDLSFTPF